MYNQEFKTHYVLKQAPCLKDFLLNDPTVTDSKLHHFIRKERYIKRREQLTNGQGHLFQVISDELDNVALRTKNSSASVTDKLW